MNKSIKPLSLAVLAAISGTATAATDQEIEVISVKGEYRQTNLANTSNSIAVLTDQDLADQNIQHFQEALSHISNVNFAGGSSRPKYIQIRGVGERSEYRGAPNSSVGFIVDDIDLSGLGMAASMYDVEQVEVLKGPQGTRFGANALAGMIYVSSNEVTEVFEGGVKASVGNDDLRNFAGYASGFLTDKLGVRVALESHKQNGYIDNSFLNIDDSNGIDELTGKIKVKFLATEALTIDFTHIFADLDNGYDAWTLDNNGYNTLTDLPGQDSQDSSGSSLKFTYTGIKSADLVSITSFTNTDHRHAYDGDWANPEYWANKSCTDYYDENGNGEYDDMIPCVYDYLWDKAAQRDVLTQEVRLVSKEDQRIFDNTTDWVLGAYYSKLDENNDLDSSYNGWPDEVLTSNYEATNVALFAQLDSSLSEKSSLSVGARVERRNADYSDSNADAFDPSETMWGGHIAYSYQIDNVHQAYARIARGYKAGGFNMGLPSELAQFKEFETETLVNYELGLTSNLLARSLTSRIALFYMDRKDQQVNASQQNPDRPQRFVIYTANAASSESLGLEVDLDWQMTNEWTAFVTLGYLDASYDNYAYFDKYGSLVDISGRELAHAPKYTYSTGLNYRGDNNVFANVTFSGKDEFYFSDSHNTKADSSYNIDAKVGYEQDDWSVYLWARNLTDEKNATRGFFFGNEPDLDWASKPYQRFAPPRQVGVTLDYKF